MQSECTPSRPKPERPQRPPLYERQRNKEKRVKGREALSPQCSVRLRPLMVVMKPRHSSSCRVFLICRFVRIEEKKLRKLYQKEKGRYCHGFRNTRYKKRNLSKQRKRRCFFSPLSSTSSISERGSSRIHGEVKPRGGEIRMALGKTVDQNDQV